MEKKDVLSGFIKPPKGYGEVSFYWWLGDVLDKERIKWQMDKLKNKSISGLQVNYAHSDKGGRYWGYTYENSPKLFSDEWWELYNWFLKEAKENGIAVSLSDYTIGMPGQGWYTDEVINENPSIYGAVLKREIKEIENGEAVKWELPKNILSLSAYRVEDAVIIEDSFIDLSNKVSDNSLECTLSEGKWKLIAVCYEVNDMSIDPMNKLAGPKVIEKFFQRFEDRNPNEGGEGLNFFFSDELQLGVEGNLWNDKFRDEFKARKGYDIVPKLQHLYEEIGQETPKIRLDYRDVMVNLEEENYFKPVFDWHEERNMIYGCDHGGRGTNVIEFGDYFRTQRWNQGPGCDQPNLGSDTIKNKVASSISHLYNRPRTWLEGYYGSGWGTSTEQVVDATFRNFAMGHNLLTLHGLYYSTHGGWWEWAPPCNHFRMPYWEHMDSFMKCSERLSYLLSQGKHVCDVAIVYPVSAMEAGIDGRTSVDTAFGTARKLYFSAIDLDFIDFESVQRAVVEDKKIKVSGEEYKVLVLPAMKAIRYSVIEKAYELYKNGGIVISVGALPIASERVGYNDEILDKMVKEIFGVSQAERDNIKGISINENNVGGKGVLVDNADEAHSFIANAFTQDFVCTSDKNRAFLLHRKIDTLDVYMVYGLEKGDKCFFRSKGKAQLWNPWTAEVSDIDDVTVEDEGCTIAIPVEKGEAAIIVFDTTKEAISIKAKDLPVTSVIEIDGAWGFEIKPTMDNRWGDYRLPAFDGLIGAEARKFNYKQLCDGEQTKTEKVTYSFGPHFLKLGALPDDVDKNAVEQELLRSDVVSEDDFINIKGEKYNWQKYNFSMRFCIENDPGHQGYHGLKGEMSDDFIALGKCVLISTGSKYEKEEIGSVYYMWSTVFVEKDLKAKVKVGNIKPTCAWINGQILDKDIVELKAGHNSILLRYEQVGRTHFVLEAENEICDWVQNYPLAMNWYNKPSVLNFDIYPQDKKPIGEYTFVAPPGLCEMTITAYGKVSAYVNGEMCVVERVSIREDGAAVYKASVKDASKNCSDVKVLIEQLRGVYAGEAMPEPIKIECKAGEIELGDWSKIEGLESYSGGVVYTKNIVLNDEQAKANVYIELGDVVSSAEIIVNGKSAKVLLSKPWRANISSLVNNGDNKIEVLVYNTLANHYTTIPTKYRGELKAGLMGPVKIIFE